MGKFSFIETPIEGLYVVTPKVFFDERGFFMETYHYEEFKAAGLDMNFVQDNCSQSKRGVLRGLHFQTKHPQGKLVRVVHGKVFDVAVDLRHESPTFGQWFGVELSADLKNQFYIPEGFAHGFLVLSPDAEFAYKCTDYYDPSGESGIKWDDPDLCINWPIENDVPLLLSPKDLLLQSWAAYAQKAVF